MFTSVFQVLSTTAFFSTSVVNMDGGLHCVLPKNGHHEPVSIESQRKKIYVKYLSARLRKDYVAAYNLSFQLGPVTADDVLDVDSGWADFVEARKTCCICMSNPTTALTKCMHVFCHTCINAWLQKHESCPMCRQHLCRYTIHSVPIRYVFKQCKQCKKLR